MNTAIRDIVTNWWTEGAGSADVLIERLSEREQELADHLRETAMQNGLAMPFIALVLADAGMGEDVDETQMQFLRDQMVALQAQVQETLLAKQAAFNEFMRQFFGAGG